MLFIDHDIMWISRMKWWIPRLYYFNLQMAHIFDALGNSAIQAHTVMLFLFLKTGG